MHVHFLDPFHALESPIHSADPRVKISCTLLYIAACSLMPIASWPAYLLLFAVVLAAEILSRLDGIPIEVVLSFCFKKRLQANFSSPMRLVLIIHQAAQKV